MFDEDQKPPGANLTTPAIVLASSAGGLLLSIGLCGIRGAPQSALAQIGILIFLLSVFGLLTGFIWLICALIANLFN